MVMPGGVMRTIIIIVITTTITILLLHLIIIIIIIIIVIILLLIIIIGHQHHYHGPSTTQVRAPTSHVTVVSPLVPTCRGVGQNCCFICLNSSKSKINQAEEHHSMPRRRAGFKNAREKRRKRKGRKGKERKRRMAKTVIIVMLYHDEALIPKIGDGGMPECGVQ
jgi:hypothetical protein